MKTGFFEEGPENKSSNRLIFIVGSSWVMCLVSFLAYKGGTDWAGLLAVFSGMIGTLGGLKLGQKAMENKTEDAEKPK